MQYDLIIKNGIVILESGETNTDIAIKNGKIAAIGPNLEQAEQIIDAQGLIVSPGMVDIHVHISEPGVPNMQLVKVNYMLMLLHMVD